jgi:homoserine dehydrogenase
LVANFEQKQQAGQAGLQVVNANKGALAKHLEIVRILLQGVNHGYFVG